MDAFPLLRHDVSRRRSPLRRAAWVAARTPSLLVAAPTAAIGGQAVIDGVMMRGPHSWAVAVRRFDGTVPVQHRELVSFAARHAWARLPLVRGVVALFEALVIGMRALFVASEYAIEAAEQQLADEPDADAARHEAERAASRAGVTSPAAVPIPMPHDEASAAEAVPDPDSMSTWAIVIAMVVALAFSIGLFKVVPVTITTYLPLDRGSWAFVLTEVAIKFGIFCLYLAAIGLLPDMRRTFEYHSAEHKAINAWERGVSLEPEAVNRMSQIHVRCGTAFIVWVFLVGVLVFRAAQLTFLDGASRLEIIGARPLLLPIIAGVSFEILRFAGRHADNPLLRVVLAPGLWFQRLTTRACTPEQCEVAIRSLEVVLEHEQQRQAAGAGASSADAHGREGGDGHDAYQVLA